MESDCFALHRALRLSSQRRRRDSNPRRFRAAVFKTAAFVHSATPPKGGGGDFYREFAAYASEKIGFVKNGSVSLGTSLVDTERLDKAIAITNGEQVVEGSECGGSDEELVSSTGDGGCGVGLFGSVLTHPSQAAVGSVSSHEKVIAAARVLIGEGSTRGSDAV